MVGLCAVSNQPNNQLIVQNYLDIQAIGKLNGTQIGLWVCCNNKKKKLPPNIGGGHRIVQAFCKVKQPTFSQAMFTICLHMIGKNTLYTRAATSPFQIHKAPLNKNIPLIENSFQNSSSTNLNDLNQDPLCPVRSMQGWQRKRVAQRKIFLFATL